MLQWMNASSNMSYLEYVLLQLYYPLSPIEGHVLLCTTMYKLWCKIENDSTSTSSILVIPDEQWDIYLEEYAWIMRDNDFDRCHRQGERMFILITTVRQEMSYSMPWRRELDDQYVNIYGTFYQIYRSSRSNTISQNGLFILIRALSE
jgi:hypothetical protein